MTGSSSPGRSRPGAVPRRCATPARPPVTLAWMRAPDDFDAFYKDARTRLLLQTYALTGDLPASRAAVRDAFIVAWHHWRKVSRLDDPEASVRPQAWAHAQRRHTARVWHRDKSLDPEVSADPRRARQAQPRPAQGAAAHAAHHRLDGRHRPRGRPPPRGRRARAADRHRAYARHRDIASTEARRTLEPLRAQVDDARLAAVARSSAGPAPRGGVPTPRWACWRRSPPSSSAACSSPRAATSGPRSPTTRARRARSPPRARSRRPRPCCRPTTCSLRTSSPGWRAEARLVRGPHLRQLRRHRHGGALPPGAVRRPRRRRDPDASLRRGQGEGRARPLGGPDLRALGERARRADAFDTAVDWYAGCLDRRMQLLSTAPRRQGRRRGGPVRAPLVEGTGHHARGRGRAHRPGDDDHREPDARHRRGRPGRTDGPRWPRPRTRCAERPARPPAPARPQLTDIAPLPAGDVPGMLTEVDLPPVTRVDKPWVGTQVRKATVNYAASGCARASFQRRGRLQRPDPLVRDPQRQAARPSSASPRRSAPWSRPRRAPG